MPDIYPKPPESIIPIKQANTFPANLSWNGVPPELTARVAAAEAKNDEQDVLIAINERTD